jgi:hypothetical protein
MRTNLPVLAIFIASLSYSFANAGCPAEDAIYKMPNFPNLSAGFKKYYIPDVKISTLGFFIKLRKTKKYTSFYFQKDRQCTSIWS